HVARHEFTAARAVLQPILAGGPQVFWARVALAHLLLVEGRDPAAAEQALREVLALNPEYGPARDQLALLVQRQQRARPAAASAQECRPNPTCQIVVGGW